MNYVFPVTAPPNTPRTSPVRTRALLTAGTITRAEMHFPAGCAGLAGARVIERAHILWPSSPEQWVISDDFTVAFDAAHQLTEAPFRLTLALYNEDTTYPHTVTFRFTVDLPVENPLWAVARAMARTTREGRGMTSAQAAEMIKILGQIRGDLHGIRTADVPMLADYLHAILSRLEAAREETGVF